MESRKTATVSAIASIGRNCELGKGAKLIWRISDDLRRVKTLTMGHPLIMGRKTYESIGKPLPGRTTIIISRDKERAVENCFVVSSLEEALKKAHEIDKEEIFIFGGAQIYALAMPYVERLYLTIVDAEDPDADTFFPEFSDFDVVVEREKRKQDELVYEWLTLERKHA